MENDSLNFGYGMGLADANEFIQPIKVLLEDLKTNTIIYPEHQREYVWTTPKQKRYIDRIFNSKRKPIGVIGTYQIDLGNGKGSSFYLNDGRQRLTTIELLIADPSRYGRTQKEVSELLSTYKIPMQHRHYESHEEAALDFQDINMGTTVTPFDFYKANLVYAKNHKLFYPILEKLINNIFECDSRITKAPSRDSDAGKKAIRDIYCLLHREMIEEYGIDSKVYLKAASPTISQSPKADESIEYMLKKDLENKSISEIEEICNRLSTTIYNNCAIIESIIPQVAKRISEYNSTNPQVYKREFIEKTLSHVQWRFINLGMIYLRKKKISIDKITEIVSEILFVTEGINGGKYIIGKDNKVVPTAYQKCGSFRNMVKLVGYNLEELKRIPRDTSRIKKGNDLGHIKPHSLYGEGEVTPEPSSINRAKGNREAVLV